MTFAFSSRVLCDCSVALILSMSSFMMYVAVVGAVFPAWANAGTGLTTDTITRTFTTVFFIASLPEVLLLLRRCWPASHRHCPDGYSVPDRERLLQRRRLIQRWRDWSIQTHSPACPGHLDSRRAMPS